ncbi:MAG TPA: translocation/assembly module TamB domain-containing protein, partial [Gammaproteobacteria bacterium]|nr:translocation/assembly module TamB domain-containing protein [Gammaproteobacteria bacterium]
HIQVEYKKDHWTIHANPVHWKHPQYGVLPEIELNFTLYDQKKYTGTVEVLFSKNKIAGTYTIDPNQDHALEGLLKGDFNDISFLSKFSKDLKKLNGHIQATLHLGGHLKKPKFWGESTLTKTQIPLPALGTDIKLQQLHLHSKGDGNLTITGTGQLGTGDFSLNGSGNFLNDTPQMHLALTGKNLLVSKTPEYSIWANPNVTIQIKNGTPEITGSIFIPKAKITMQSKQNYIGTSSDVIIVKNKQSLTPVEKPHPLQQFKTHITIELGEDVHFKGYGLDSYFVGKVNVSGEQGKPWLGSGKLNLKEGKFKARNRVLHLTKGQIFYAETPLINPALDIRAQREVKPIVQHTTTTTRDLFAPYEMPVEKIIVGVALTGTLKSPHIRLYSQPSLPEGDILSYLILDKPQKAASFTEGKILFEAASEMMHQFGLQKNDIRPSLVEKFHLDTLDLKTANTRDPSKSALEDTVLVVGKQISDRLYAEYSVGLMDKASTLSLRYLVGKHITLETQASKNSVSADILFIFESG